MTYRHIFAVGAVACLLPFATSALTSDEITQQISELVGQLTALQAQLKNVTAQSVPNTAPATSTAAATPGRTGVVCPVFNLTLSRGSRGDAVIAVQKFLISRGFLTAPSATGFFGPITESAVRNLQAQQDIVSGGDAASTGWGVVGARTSAAIVKLCYAGYTSQLNSSSSNSTGCATVPVPSSACNGTWTATPNPKGCVAAWQCVAGAQATTTVPASCPVYQMPSCSVGFSAQWRGNDSNNCSLGYQCIISQTTTSASFSASPTSGRAPLGVVFRTNKQGTQVDFGDGTSALVSSDCTTGLNGSTNCNTSSYFTNHYYQSAGTYTASLKGIPINGGLPALYGRITITVQ